MKDRLERLKGALHLEWGELAGRLEVSRSMLDQVRRGDRSFGPKIERRLLELEHLAGLAGNKLIAEESPHFGYTGPAQEAAKEIGRLKKIIAELQASVAALEAKIK